ncbi:hypothetical protein [uncultured Microbulbifer sp.]|uniref:hypothetical protein n=1 Tax=uncultured Microbulbifer sp. TaxID=348147 RepID=UPI0025EEAA78|nr:hypothetical protein [uncultured Microbulbifer sp.]
MIEFVTQAEAENHLRIDSNDSIFDAPWLAVFIPAISEAVVEWVKDPDKLYIPEYDSNGDPVIDSNGEPVPDLDSNGHPQPKPLVKAAVLIELERQYRSRGGEDDTFVEDFGNAGYGYVLGRGSVALLTSLRRSTVA